MFCNKCGKKIEYDSQFCNECLQEENARLKKECERIERERNSEYKEFENEKTPESDSSEEKAYIHNEFDIEYNEFEQKYPTAKNPIMQGFGPALTAAILSFMGYIITAVLYFALYELYAAPLFSPIAIPMYLLGIPAVILSIKSMILFRDMKRRSEQKPIPAFVLSIISFAFVGAAIIMCMTGISLI